MHRLFQKRGLEDVDLVDLLVDTTPTPMETAFSRMRRKASSRSFWGDLLGVPDTGVKGPLGACDHRALRPDLIHTRYPTMPADADGFIVKGEHFRREIALGE